MMKIDFENDFFISMAYAIFCTVGGIAFFSTFVYFLLNSGFIAAIFGALTIGFVLALAFGFAGSMAFVVVYGICKLCLAGRNITARHNQNTIKA